MLCHRIAVLALAAVTFAAGPAFAQSLTDLFSARPLLTAEQGEVRGQNLGAGLEVDEPRHADRPGGSSVWTAWRAPADGIATFSTDGSDFDTLLAAYYFPKPEDATLDRLKVVARNDDDPARPPTSLIQFGARAGVVYQLAVDGYRGASGSIRLRWDFVPAAAPPPIIVSLPQDRAARQGDPVILTVEMEVSPDLDLQWRFNGNSFGARGPTLVIPDLQPETVGLYSLRIGIDNLRFETPPVEVQINSEGQTNALARDKLFDALESPLTPEDKGGGGGHLRLMGRRATADVGVSRGYNGTQIFNTVFATTDPDEPAHCGSAPGATYWFAYEPPDDGLLEVDTAGSTYPTLLAAYTYAPPLTSYAGLVPVACSSPDTNGAARVEFAAQRARPFFVVVASPTAARGITHLNYRLDTNRAPRAPSFTGPAVNLEIAAGTPVLLDPGAAGSPPIRFTWFKDSHALPGETNATFALKSAVPADSGEYQVQAANVLGQAWSPVQRVRVLMPPRLRFQVAGGLDVASFDSLTGHVYGLEFRDAVAAGAWLPVGEPVPGTGSVIDLHVPHSRAGAGYFRVRVR